MEPWQGNKDKHESKNPLIKFFNDKLKRDIIEAVEDYNPKSILDIGCGEGFITSLLADRFKEADVMGLDIEEEYIKYAKMFNKRKNVFYGVNGIYTLPPNRYDLIVATELLEHLKTPQKAIECLKKVSKGVILITIPNEPYFRLGNLCSLKYITRDGNTPGHLHNWSKNTISKLLKEMNLDFEIKSSSFWNIILVK